MICFSVPLFIPTYIYIFIYLILIGDSLDCILYFKVPSHCIVINISLFIYTEKVV